MWVQTNGGKHKNGQSFYALMLIVETWDPNPLFYRPKDIVMVGVTGYGKSNG
jgi:hypothetical protein